MRCRHPRCPADGDEDHGFSCHWFDGLAAPSDWGTFRQVEGFEETVSRSRRIISLETQPMMEEIRENSTRVAAVADEIRRAIIRRELPQGTPLREVELAETYNVSRGTMREALRSLQEDGLVEVVPFRGASVPAMSARQAREVFSVRAELEPWGLRMAMEQQAFSEKDLRDIEGLLRQMDEYQTQGDVYHHAITDTQVHMMISERSGHALLVEIIRTLRWKTVLYQAQLVTQDTSHWAVLHAIRAGNPLEASNVLRQHILEAGERLTRTLSEPGRDRPAGE
jgi:DNA-binding GntR family transcriptional regulator